VLITTDMQVKLIDFGLSEVVYPGETLSTMCGTPLYCSPEVLFLHTKYRSRSAKGFYGGPADVWSVGILIFALLTGCAPFDDSSFQRLRHEVSRRAVMYPSHLSDEVKGMLKEVLVFDPYMRPTIKDLLDYAWLKRDRSLTCTSVSSTGVAASPSIVEHLAEISADSEVPSESISDLDEDEDDLEADEEAPTVVKCGRSLSCHSAACTEGTSSANSSLEDSREKEEDEPLASPVSRRSSLDVSATVLGIVGVST
jgi:serine/threonine protein kinase